MEVRVYATLRQIVGARRVEVDCPGPTVQQAMEALISRYPALSDRLLTDAGEVRPFVAVMLDGRDIRHLNGLQTPVSCQSGLDIFPPVAGGRR